MKKEVKALPISPLGDRILVTRVEPKLNNESIIIIPDTAKEKPQFGLVRGIGDKVTSIKENTLILFGKYAGTELTILREEVLLMREEEVLAVVRNAEFADSIF